jgi:hypothetical protein
MERENQGENQGKNQENERKLKNYFSYLFLDVLHQIGGKIKYDFLQNHINIIKPPSHMWLGVFDDYDFIKYNSNDCPYMQITIDTNIPNKMFNLMKQKKQGEYLILLLSVKYYQDQRRKFMETVGRELIQTRLHPDNIHKFVDWGLIENDTAFSN